METHIRNKQELWGPGPWVDEPDRVEWRDDATGLPCLALRNPRYGHWCGYVGAHRDPGDIYELDVHGGVTYGPAPCSPNTDWHRVCHVPKPGEPEVSWVGFDCGHAGYDDPDACPGGFVSSREGTYRTIAFVRSECAKLAAQLK